MWGIRKWLTPPAPGVLRVKNFEQPLPVAPPQRPGWIERNFDRICLYLDRMPTEFRVLSVRDATLRDPRIKYTGGYTKWAIQNHHVLA